MQMMMGPNGAGDDGREIAHHRLGAEHLEEGGQHHIEESCQHHAEAGVGEHLRVGGQAAVLIGDHGGDGLIAADKREGRAQKGGHLPLGQKVEQQRPQPRKQKRCGNGHSRERGNQNSGAEHGKHVLSAQHKHFGPPQLPGVVDALGLIHGCFSLLFRLYPHKKRQSHGDCQEHKEQSAIESMSPNPSMDTPLSANFLYCIRVGGKSQEKPVPACPRFFLCTPLFSLTFPGKLDKLILILTWRPEGSQEKENA